ncbi:MAG TPA: hypothetical protein PK961_11870 [bacterium]|nr:hypothetical protein [bacterium]
MKVRILLLILGLVLFSVLIGCENEDDDDDDSGDDDTGAADDDTDEGYQEPWNDEPERPIVTITSPQPGEFLETNTFTVSGTVTGAPAEKVYVNDEEVALNGATFQTTVTHNGDRIMPVYASALTADMLSGGDRVVAVRGEMADPAEIVEDALLVALGDELFTSLGALLDEQFTELDLSELFEPLNPVIDILGTTVSITQLVIGGAALDGEFADDGVHVFGELQDLTLGLTIEGLLSDEATITIGAMSLDMKMDVTLVDGTAQVTVSSIDLAHSDVTYDGSLGFLGSAGLDLLLKAVEGVIELAAKSIVPGLLEGLLADLTLDTTLIGFDLSLGLTTVDIAAGAMIAGVDFNISLTDPADHPWPNGSLTTTGTAPDMLTGRPADATEFALGLALNDDFLNRFLFGAAEADLLQLTVADPSIDPDALPLPLTAGVLGALLPGFASVDPSIQASVELYPMTPPVALTDANGAMFIYLPDMRIDFYLHPAGHAPWRAMTLSTMMVFSLDLNAVDGEALLLAVPEFVLDIKMLDNPLGDSGFVFNLLSEWLTDLVAPLLNSILGALPIDLPPLAGLEIDPLWLGTAGESLDYWTGYFGLTYAP